VSQTAIVKRAAHDLLAEKKQAFLAVLPRDVDADRFYALALAITKDPKLSDCSVSSKLDCVYRFAKLGLDPDPTFGEGYVIPRKLKDVGVVASFQPGYRGLTKLARKSKGISDIHAEVVYEGEEFRVSLGTNRVITHVPWYATAAKEPGNIVLAYCTWRDTASGAINFHVVNMDRIDRARAMNRSRDGSDSKVWRDDPAAMSRKTAIIDASKFWPLSADLAEAIHADEQAMRDEPQTPAAPAVLIGEPETPAKSELDDFIEADVTGADTGEVEQEIATDFIDKSIGTYAAFYEAFEGEAHAVANWTPEVFGACVKAVCLAYPVKDEGVKGANARRDVLTAMLAGKLSADGKITK
jgi:recombination protein RecT